MRSHTLVVYHFLAGLWLDSKGDLRSQRATGMILDKLLRFRTADWYIWLGLLMLGTKMEIGLYIAAWLRAHFLPEEPLAEATHLWRIRFRRRRFGAVSWLALLIGQ